MKRSMIMILLSGLAFTAALAAAPALADGVMPVPVPVIVPQAAPNWTPVPGVPGVHYAPNLQYDVFRHGGGYYCQQDGRWFRSGAVQGPWTVIQGPPPVFRRIEAPYFKVPPGWARGKKTGWGSAHMPPGQAKKYGCGPGYIPPGQMKKMH